MTYVLRDSEGDFEAIPGDTLLEVEVVALEERDSFFFVDKDDPSKGKQKEVSFRFKVIDENYPEYAGRTLFGSTPTTFTNNPNCKLRVWVEEILGTDNLPVGFKFNPDDLYELNVLAEIEEYPKTKGGTGNRVKALRRAAGYAAASAEF